MRFRELLFFTVFLFDLSAALFAIDKVIVPYLTGPVVDEAQLISPEERTQVQNLVEKLNASGRVQMAVLIAQSLQGFDIESYSIAVAEQWKLGKKKEDRGLIFLVAPNERKMRLEVGYGLEGELTDALSRRILDQDVTPYFKAGRYRDGLMVGIEDVAKHLDIDLTAPVADRLSPGRSDRGESLPLVLALFFLILFFLLSALSPQRRYRGGWWNDGGWGGGGFGGWGGGGGGFGGGGGGFGGGGSSSSW